MNRRQNLTLCSKVELIIFDAIEEVEKLGASENLTEAVIKLDQARNLVADFIDKQISES